MQETPKDKDKRKVKAADWATKTCECCSNSVSQPSVLDLKENREFRKWCQRYFWGPICWWCYRMMLTIYAHWSMQQFVRHLKSSEEALAEAKIQAFSYLTLREEGKVQIDIVMLRHRATLLKRAAEIIPVMLSNRHEACMLLSAFAAASPERNPISLGFPIIQMIVDGNYRLGVRFTCPASSAGALATTAASECASPLITTEEASDLAILKGYCERAREASVAAGSASSGVGDNAAGKRNKNAKADSGGDGDGEGSHALNDRVPIQKQFPKGRFGNGCRKMQEKVEAILAGLGNANWNDFLKDSTLRANLRTASGLGVELKTSTFPELIQINADHQAILSAAMGLCSAVSALKKDDTHHVWLPFLEPLEALEKWAEQMLRGNVEFYPELSLYLVLI